MAAPAGNNGLPEVSMRMIPTELREMIMTALTEDSDNSGNGEDIFNALNARMLLYGQEALRRSDPAYKRLHIMYDPTSFAVVNELTKRRYINVAVEEIDIVTDILDGDAVTTGHNADWNTAAQQFRALTIAQLTALNIHSFNPAAPPTQPDQSLHAAITAPHPQPPPPAAEEHPGAPLPRLRRLTLSFFTRDAHGGLRGARALDSGPLGAPQPWLMDNARVVRVPAGTRAPGGAVAADHDAARDAPALDPAASVFRAVVGLPASPPGAPAKLAAVPRLRRSHRRLTSYYALLEAVGVRPAGTGVGGVGHGDHRGHAVGTQARADNRAERREARRQKRSGSAMSAGSNGSAPSVGDAPNSRRTSPMQVDGNDGDANRRSGSPMSIDDANNADMSGSEYEGPERFDDICEQGHPTADLRAPANLPPATAPARGATGKRKRGAAAAPARRPRFPLAVRSNAALMRRVVQRAAIDAGLLARAHNSAPLQPAGAPRAPMVSEFFLRGMAYGLAGDWAGAQATRDWAAAHQRFRTAPVFTHDLEGVWDAARFEAGVEHADAVAGLWDSFALGITTLALCVWGRRGGTGAMIPQAEAWDQAALVEYVRRFDNIDTLELCMPPLSMLASGGGLPVLQRLDFEMPWPHWQALTTLHIESTYFEGPGQAWIDGMQPRLRKLTFKRCGMVDLDVGWGQFIMAICVAGFDLEVFTLDRCWVAACCPDHHGDLDPPQLVNWAPVRTASGPDDPPFLDLSDLQELIHDQFHGTAWLCGLDVFNRASVGEDADVSILEFKQDRDQA